MALLARRTNDRKVVGSRPTKVVCITVLTGNRIIIIIIIIMKARITVTLYIKMLQGHFTQSITMKTRCQCQ